MRSKYNENGLTTKQQMFVNEYLINGYNARAAYHFVYPNANEKTCTSNSYTLMQKEEVKTYISKKLKEIEDAKIATAKERMQFYSSVLRGEETEEVLYITENGPEKIDKKATIRDRIRAGELMEKIENIGGINKQEVTISPFLEDALHQLFGEGDTDEEV